jgi:glutamate-1-semialdehyde 2,1-aminomutase
LASNGVYPRFFHAMLRRGVALAPGAYEVMFPGLSHGDDVLDRVVSAAGEAAVEVASRTSE